MVDYFAESEKSVDYASEMFNTVGVMSDQLGDRMKKFEEATDQRCMPLLPTLVRLDGRCFSNLTKKMDLEEPYDQRLCDVMDKVTRSLVDESNALVGYTQSDEITLLLHSDDYRSSIFFDGKIRKITSVLAGLASAEFNLLLDASDIHVPLCTIPVFDCRVWQVPNKVEAVNSILWRELDATKNSIQSLARTFYSHTELHGKGRAEQLQMLESKGVFWGQYPTRFKKGAYFRRINYEVSMKDASGIPEHVRRMADPNQTVTRSKVVNWELPPLSRISNRVEVIFNGAEPEVFKED